MNMPAETDKVKLFIQRHMGKTLFSTGARLVEFEDVLYNISGSTDDPKAVRDYEGMHWKNLLTAKGLGDAHCYVNNFIPEEPSSHDEFSVGGHMTTNPNGKVRKGGISYLMPLCHWHNNPARNGKPFEHQETTMLELTGFMEDETPVTFLMRMPAEEQGVLLYFDMTAQSWQFKKLDTIQRSDSKLKLFSSMTDVVDPIEEYAILEKTESGYFLSKSELK